MAVHYSSQTPEWATPQWLFDRLNAEFAFTLDVCATAENAKCPKFFTKEDDGLKQEWSGVCWMNPVYGDPEYPCKTNCKKKKCVTRGHHISEYVPGIADFLKKALRSAMSGVTVICLVPARPGSSWFYEYCRLGVVKFIVGRLKFNDGEDSAPFDSAIVEFHAYLDPGRTAEWVNWKKETGTPKNGGLFEQRSFL